MRKIQIYLSCDADPDQATTSEAHRPKLSWEGLNFLEALGQEFEKRQIPWTLFVRLDDQIASLFGRADALFLRHKSFLDRHFSLGNEIAWHPHLYTCEGDKYQLVTDPDLAVAQLKRNFPWVPVDKYEMKSVRLGEAWQSNATLSLLNELGFKIDSTAIPGRHRLDPDRVFDWRGSPNRPYHPSRHDYRIESDASLNILEVPMTTGEIQTEYDQFPLRRYLNLTFHEELFQSGVKNFLSESKDMESITLVTIFHPGELNSQQANGLYAYSWPAFLKNLDFLCKLGERYGFEQSFGCLRDLVGKGSSI